MTYDFCFQFDKGNAFVGCSPECLFSSSEKNIYSEAIAGTRLKGTGAAEQKKYRAELIESEKEQLEHDYVFDDVTESLAEICDSVEIADRRQVVSLSYLQHFRSSFNGQLKDGVYEGSYRGGPNKASVEVTIENNNIIDILIVEHWTLKGKSAELIVPGRIIENQSTDVDAVSGATNSSIVIMNAVQRAVEKAHQD